MTEVGFWHLSVFHVSKERFSVISRSAALVRVITLLYLQRTCSFGVADSKATLQCACVLRAGWEKKGCYRDKLLNSVLLGSLFNDRLRRFFVVSSKCCRHRANERGVVCMSAHR